MQSIGAGSRCLNCYRNTKSALNQGNKTNKLRKVWLGYGIVVHEKSISRQLPTHKEPLLIDWLILLEERREPYTSLFRNLKLHANTAIRRTGCLPIAWWLHLHETLSSETTVALCVHSAPSVQHILPGKNNASCQDKCLKAKCREKPWKSPGSNLRHRLD